MKVEPKTAEKLTTVRRRVTSIALLFVAVFLLLSLLTSHNTDLTGAAYPRPAEMGNACGRVGAAISEGLFNTFGYAAYLAVALVVAFAVRCLMKKDAIDMWLNVLGGLMMLIAGAGAAQMVGPKHGIIAGAGGVVGIAVSDLLHANFGGTGSWLVTILFLSFGAVLTSLDEIILWGCDLAAARMKQWYHDRRTNDAAAAMLGVKPTSKTATPAKPEDKPASAAKPFVKLAEKPKTEPSAATAAASPVATAVPAPAKPAAKTEETPKDKAAEPAAPEKRVPPPIKTHTTKVESVERLSIPASTAAGKYELPPLTMLEGAKGVDQSMLEANIRENSAIIERTLSEFGIGAQVVGIEKGPSVTRYEIAIAPGIKVNRITSLQDDIAMAVKSSSVRIVAPIPGKSTAGIEVPNAVKETVCLLELLTCPEYLEKREKYIIPLMLGKDASGAPIISDLVRMPHLLIAGATGSGKSVCLNSIIVTMMMLHRPEDMRLILVDPKMVDMGMFERIPHLLTPVVTDMKRAPFVLEWATKQMDERYDWLARAGVRHITEYNKLGLDGLKIKLGDEYKEDEVPAHMPYIVIIVDELADMMMVASKEVELHITRLAQKSRAVGIHIILATQRPSVDVITGLIKSNLPTRISFQVTSKVDSRTILDRNGAEQLIGSGDLLFIPPGTSNLIRVQGTYCSDREIKGIVDFVKKQGDPGHLFDIKQLGQTQEASEEGEFGPDDLYEDACRVVLESKRGSVSLLQRKFGIGYTRSARLIDMMAAEGIVGAYMGSKARQVVMTLEEWEEKRGIPVEQRTSRNRPPRDEFADEDAALEDGDDIDES